METQTIITVLLALISCYRLVELLIKIIIGFVVMLALFVIVWGVCEKVGRNNMDDLISRQEAIDRLSEVLSSEEEFEKAKEVILEAPTAYNVEKGVLKELLAGKWVETEKVQNALGMTFKECFEIFEFSRTAEWWSIVGKTEEERQRNGQKISTYFRLKAGGVNG